MRHRRRGMLGIVPLLAGLLVGGLLVGAQAQLARTEIHPLPSLTLDDEQLLTGAREQGEPVVLAAELHLPAGGGERLPTVVLIHGSGGIGANIEAWARELHGLGVATLIVDSFSGRGIVSTVNDQTQLGRLAMIVDAYAALGKLAAHPRVDPARIALMGFSRGGQAVLYASLKRLQRLHAPAEARFAAYMPFYAACSTRYAGDTEVADAPIRLFHGDADDYNPAAACRAYVERLRDAGKDVEMVEYPGAHHAFDSASFRAPLTLPDAPTTRNCRLEEDEAGRIIDADTGEAFTYDDACVEFGPTVAYDAGAHQASVAAVKEFLSAIFGLR